MRLPNYSCAAARALEVQRAESNRRIPRVAEHVAVPRHSKGIGPSLYSAGDPFNEVKRQRQRRDSQFKRNVGDVAVIGEGWVNQARGEAVRVNPCQS